MRAESDRLQDALCFAAGDSFQNAIDDVIRTDPFRFGIKGWHHAMAEDGFGERLDIVVCDMKTTLQDGANFPGEHQVLACTGAGSPFDQILYESRGFSRFWAGKANEIENE